MRTTVEITDDQRARLLELAARRGLKGFSQLVREALEHYLTHATEGAERRDRALATRGALSDEDADAFEERVREIRDRWR